jgi:glycosyltransferase involved in cell wall biosynthesis
MSVDIALFLPGFKIGGVERIRLNLAAGFLARGYKVDLVAARADGPLLSEVPEGVRVIDLGTTRIFRSLPALARYMRREQPRALLSALDYANVVALWARQLSGAQTRVVVGTHKVFSLAISQSPLWRERNLLPLAVRRTYPMADGIVAISQGLGEDLARAAGVTLDRISVIHNPALTPKVLELAEEPAGHPWLDRRVGPVLLSVGRLHEEKDFPTLLRAFALLRKQFDSRLIIVGEGAERAKLERLRDELGLGAAVSMPGSRTNPYAFMKRADLFVSTSIWEGFGNVHVEALACGCPVVSTDAPTGPADILKYGRFGRLVSVGNAEALAQAMLETLNSPPDAERLKARANDFHIDRIIEQYRQVLNI